MTFLTTPERASTLGTCNCTQNHGTVSYKTCSSNCSGNCTKLRVCVTPTGGKVTINGVGTAS